MLVLLVAVYACMELREFYPKGSDIREGMKSWHFMLGITVLALVIVRIVVRAQRPAPPIAPKQPNWQIWLARIVHLLLYAFMIGMPVAGWLILSASGKTICQTTDKRVCVVFTGIMMPAFPIRPQDDRR